MSIETRPVLLDSFEYQGHVDVEWYDVADKDSLPDLPWRQIYAVADLDGAVPIVLYEGAIPNLPGGKPESGETVEVTLNREIEEELNCRVLAWEPLGYQALHRESEDEVVYQLRVFAKLEKIGDFRADPGGSVIGYETVPLDNLNDRIRYGRVGSHLCKLAEKYF